MKYKSAQYMRIRLMLDTFTIKTKIYNSRGEDDTLQTKILRLAVLVELGRLLLNGNL